MQTDKSRFPVAFVVLFAATSALAGAGYWPQWRGPNRDGVSTETGLLKDWAAGGPPLFWKAKGLGEGFSTVSVVSNRVYTIGDRKDSSFVTALNAEDGAPVWSAKLGKPGDLGGYKGPRGAPTVDGELLYAIGQFGDLVCLESGTGKERWRKDFGKDFGGNSPNWGFAESPLVDGDKVVVTPGGSRGAVVALNKENGAVVWQSKDFTDRAHYSSLIIAGIGGVRQYIQLTAESVAGVAADDGRLLWRARRRGEVAVIPTPIYHDGFVYVTSGYGMGCNLFKVTANQGKFRAAEAYANKVMVNHHGGVIKVGDHLYGYSDSKGWTCQDFKTGEARWQEKQKLGKGCLAYADGHFYLRAEDRAGTIALIEASPAGYKEHGRFNPPDRSNEQSWPHPVVTGGRLYIREQDALIAYDVKRG
jgi:outer membrane protein assembly factor BamB